MYLKSFKVEKPQKSTGGNDGSKDVFTYNICNSCVHPSTAVLEVGRGAEETVSLLK